MKETLDNISKLGWAVIASLITLIIYIILEKFKNRGSVFTYSRTFNSVGTTLNDTFYGNIKVLYNDTRVVKHLNFVSLNIVNTSNTDFEDVTLKCWVDVNSQILSFDAFHDLYRSGIPLDEGYLKTRNEKMKEIDNYNATRIEGDPTPQHVTNAYSFVLKNLVWKIPVWNRKDGVTFNFLIENFNGDIPLLMHPIEKKSIKLVEAENAELKNKRLGKWMFILGYLIYVISSVVILTLTDVDRGSLIIFIVLGGLYIWFGLFAYGIFQYLRSFFR